MQFIDVITRQAHPGSEAPAYDSAAQKMADAVAYKGEESVSWSVLVDDLDGTVHRRYGGVSDPCYLIDRDGRIAFYNMWTHAPTIHRAIEALFAQGGRGVVLGGVDRRPHVLAALVNGWSAIERGLPQSYEDLEAAMPGAGRAIRFGSKLKPVLAPIALRSEPMPTSARLAIAVGIAAVALISARHLLTGGSRRLDEAV